MKKIFLLIAVLFCASCTANSYQNSENITNVSVQKLHDTYTNFPVLTLSGSFALPQNASFSGNIFINEHGDKVPLLPTFGEGKMAKTYVNDEVETILGDDFMQKLKDAKSEDYSSVFATYMERKARAQMAYHFDSEPPHGEILGVEVHFPAFFTLDSQDQEAFFTSLNTHKKSHKDVNWRFVFDTKQIDSQKMADFLDNLLEK